jgi:hypothetical protein
MREGSLKAGYLIAAPPQTTCSIEQYSEPESSQKKSKHVPEAGRPENKRAIQEHHEHREFPEPQFAQHNDTRHPNERKNQSEQVLSEQTLTVPEMLGFRESVSLSVFLGHSDLLIKFVVV